MVSERITISLLSLQTTIVFKYKDSAGHSRHTVRAVQGVPRTVIEWLPKHYASCEEWHTVLSIWEEWAWSKEEAKAKLYLALNR